MTKLTTEQKEQLADMVDSGEWDTVMALCGIAVGNHQSRLLTTDISKGDRDLLMNKAKLEGALDVQRLMDNVREYIGVIKKKG